jgi:REP element-mobilizing transposase RayT
LNTIERFITSPPAATNESGSFRTTPDRELFLNTLSWVNERFNWICHAYCLMANHYHLVIETPDGNLSKGIRQINEVYTQAYNQRHHRKSKGKDLTLQRSAAD